MKKSNTKNNLLNDYKELKRFLFVCKGKVETNDKLW